MAHVKSDDKFEVHHREANGKHFIALHPASKNEGYPPKEIEVTEEQWHSLKYHFAMGFCIENDDEKLIYVH
jgi:hypothetical protein